MDRVEIYNDGETKIEIEGWAHRYLKEIIVKTVNLSKNQYRFLLEIALDKIKEQGINYKGCTLKASSSVPVLEQHKYLSLIKPFDIFEFALTMIVSLEDWRYIDELVDLTAQYYKEENIPFCLELFKKPIYNINGFIAAKYGGELLISFFALDDEERDENFRDID